VSEDVPNVDDAVAEIGGGRVGLRIDRRGPRCMRSRQPHFLVTPLWGRSFRLSTSAAGGPPGESVDPAAPIRSHKEVRP
jgi:hypothetical protein